MDEPRLPQRLSVAHVQGAMAEAIVQTGQSATERVRFFDLRAFNTHVHRHIPASYADDFVLHHPGACRAGHTGGAPCASVMADLMASRRVMDEL